MSGTKKKFFKTKPLTEQNVNAILYVLYIDLEDKRLVKIGVTRRAIEDRVVEILGSIFVSYRVFPFCKPKRFQRTPDAFEKEKMLHDYFSSCRYECGSSFSGSTEMFYDVDTEHLLDIYARVVAGEDVSGSKYVKEDISISPV